MYDSEGAGLAAPQVGVQKRLFVYDVGEGPEVVINPIIVETSGEWYHDEGCLSIPGLRLGITRPDRVHLVGLTSTAKEVSIEADEFLGRVFLHEVDHLDGVLMAERLDPEQRKIALKVPGPGLGLDTAALEEKLSPPTATRWSEEAFWEQVVWRPPANRLSERSGVGMSGRARGNRLSGGLPRRDRSDSVRPWPDSSF